MNDTKQPALPPALQRMADEAVRICGDDPHREGVPEQIVEIMREAFKDPGVCESAMEIVRENMDLFGSNADPGFGIMGVESNRIGYREPHDHGPCWAINVQLKGRLRMVHWAQDFSQADAGTVTITKVSDQVMGPGDVDYSPPGIAHELYPETDDSVELAVRCHALTSIDVQHRYDRTSDERIDWNWERKEAKVAGRFDTVGGEGDEPPPIALAERLKKIAAK